MIVTPYLKPGGQEGEAEAGRCLSARAMCYACLQVEVEIRNACLRGEIEINMCCQETHPRWEQSAVVNGRRVLR